MVISLDLQRPQRFVFGKRWYELFADLTALFIVLPDVLTNLEVIDWQDC